MKLYIYAMEIEEVLKGDFDWSLNISSRGDLDLNDWVLMQEVDIELNVDREKLTGIAVKNLDDSIHKINGKTQAAITELEGRKQSLLALTHRD